MGLGRVLCRVGLHNWVKVRRPGVEPYWGCARCAKERMWTAGAETWLGGGSA